VSEQMKKLQNKMSYFRSGTNFAQMLNVLSPSSLKCLSFFK